MAETQDFFAWLTAYKELIVENADYLTDLDRRIGDADHGANMARGMTAVAELDPTSFADAGALLPWFLKWGALLVRCTALSSCAWGQR